MSEFCICIPKNSNLYFWELCSDFDGFSFPVCIEYSAEYDFIASQQMAFLKLYFVVYNPISIYFYGM